jgi:hypothetical protein
MALLARFRLVHFRNLFFSQSRPNVILQDGIGSQLAITLMIKAPRAYTFIVDGWLTDEALYFLETLYSWSVAKCRKEKPDYKSFFCCTVISLQSGFAPISYTK